MIKKRGKKPDIFENMNDVRTKLYCMRSYYNELTDHNLITSCIYEMNALEAQYSHLITMAKDMEMTVDISLYQAGKY